MYGSLFYGRLSVFVYTSFLVFISCTSREIVKPLPVPVPVSTEGDTCTAVDADAGWQALFDIYPISRPDFSDYEFKRDRTYKFTMEERWPDWLVNLTIGYLTTVTRHTTVLNECRLEVEVRTKDEIQQQLEDALARHLKDSRATKEMKEQPIFILKDGSSRQGRLIEYDKSEFVLEVEQIDKSGSDSSPDEVDKEGDSPETGDIVRLKSGDSVKGRVVNQSAKSVTIRTIDNKTETISKSDIAQVQFNVSLSEQNLKIESIKLKRSDVSRIRLPR